MHPSDACKHGTALPLCKKGCTEEAAHTAENNIAEIRHALNERHYLRENLKAAQTRCTELLDESRAQRRRIRVLEEEIELLRKGLEGTLTVIEDLKGIIKEHQQG